MDRWLENGYLIPGSAANLIQSIYRGYNSRKALQARLSLDEKLRNILQIYSNKKEDFLRSSLLKWNKIARRMKCDQDADTIREFCRLLREKAILDIQNKWKYLSHRLLPHALNVFLKFAKINSVLDKINKRKFMENSATPPSSDILLIY